MVADTTAVPLSMAHLLANKPQVRVNGLDNGWYSPLFVTEWRLLWVPACFTRSPATAATSPSLMPTRRRCAVRRTAATCSPTSPTTAPTSAAAPRTSSTYRARCVAWQPEPSSSPSPTTSTCRWARRRGPRPWRAGGAASCRSSWGWVRRTARYCSTSATSSLSSTCSPAPQHRASLSTTPPAFYTKSDLHTPPFSRNHPLDFKTDLKKYSFSSRTVWMLSV